MKKFVIASVMFLGLTAPSFAWNDTYPVRRPAPVPAYSPTHRPGVAPMQTSSCSPFPCGYGGVGGGNVGPNVGNGLGIPAYIYDSGIGAPNLYALPY